MIKDIQSVSNSYVFNDDIIVYEKLNMFYFKVIISNTNYTLLTHNHKIVTIADMIVNSMWYDINEFIKNNVFNKRDLIINKYGNVIIGFFYCPNEKPFVINYSKFLNNNINNKIIISNVKTLYHNEINVTDFCTNINLLNVRGVGGGPIITHNKQMIDIINSYAHKEIKLDELSKILNNISKSFSGNDFDDIEGIIIKNNKDIYQIIFNDTGDNKIYDRSDYDMLIKDFITKFDNLNLDIGYSNIVNDNYLKLVNHIFLQYIEYNNIISNIKNSDNLLPPGNHYIGDLSYQLINDNNIETICKVNNIYKNIYRILYKSLKAHKRTNKYSSLNEDDIKNWNNIIDIIIKKIRGN